MFAVSTEMLSKVFIVAVMSYQMGQMVNNAFTIFGWKYYCCLMLADLSFMYIFGVIDIPRLKRRYISILLFFGVMASSTLMMASYIYVEYKDYHLVRAVIFEMPQYYTKLCLVLTALVFLVSIMPKRILNVLDKRYWPDCLANIYSCNVMDRTKAVKASAQRCR